MLLPLRIKALLVIIPSCSTITQSMQQTTLVKREWDQAHEHAQQPGLGLGGQGGRKVETKLSLNRAIMWYAKDLPQGPKERVTFFLLKPSSLKIFSALEIDRAKKEAQEAFEKLTAAEKEKFEKEQKAAQYEEQLGAYYILQAGVPHHKPTLTDDGALEKAILETMSMQDVLIYKHLMRFIPAVLDNQTTEEIRRTLRNLYDVAEQQEMRLLKADLGSQAADTTLIASEFVRGTKRWQKRGTPVLRESYDIETQAYIAEKYASGRVQFKIDAWYIEKLRELSAEQLNFLLDLSYLNDPTVRKHRNRQVYLSSEQARLFLSLPLFIKENLLSHYPIVVRMEHQVHTHSKEFLYALRTLEPIRGPLEKQNFQRESEEAPLSREEVALIQGLTFRQRELIRELYKLRGNRAYIADNSYEFVSLSKEMQQRLLANYPLVQIKNIDWLKGMVKKHPKKSVVLGIAGIAAGVAYGPAAATAAVSAAQSAPSVAAGLSRRTIFSSVSAALTGMLGLRSQTAQAQPTRL